LFPRRSGVTSLAEGRLFRSALLVLLIVAVVGAASWPTLLDYASAGRLLRKIKVGVQNLTTQAAPVDVRRYAQEHAVFTVANQPAPGMVAAGPLRVNPANPRYFADDTGRAVYLAGAHTWLNLQDGALSEPPPAFDYQLWLDFLVSQNLNFFRLWRWEQAKWAVEWPEPYYFEPQPYLRPGPGYALDGKPRFDLTQFNQAYFDLLRARVVEAGKRGIYVSIMLFDGWSVAFPKDQYHSANPWHGHPFNAHNNVNGVDGDVNGDDSGVETQELAIPAVTALQEAYVAKVIDTVDDLDNVLYEISNESVPSSTAWQYHMIDFVHARESGLPKQHPVGMTATGRDNANLYASKAEWLSPFFDLDAPPPADGSKVIVADTDHLCGICGDRSWVWKNFTRGGNALFMDQYDDGYKLDGGGYRMDNPTDVSLRRNLGYTALFAQRMNLAATTPRADLASSGYCLANPAGSGAEYLVYLPQGGTVSVDLSATPGDLLVEWFNPGDGSRLDGGISSGGARTMFTAPFSRDAVLYLHSGRQRGVDLGFTSRGRLRVVRDRGV
jgi:hypothetical protein